MRPMRRLLVIVVSVVVAAGSVFVCTSTPAPAVEASTKVQPGETIGDVLNVERRTADGAREDASPLEAFARLLGTVLGIGVLGFVAVWFWRRGILGRSMGHGVDGLQVVGRVSLSPRHSVCLLRVGTGRAVLVGMCGDQMSPLASIDEPAELAELLSSVDSRRQTAERAIESGRVETRDSHGQGGLFDLVASWRKGLPFVGVGDKR